MKEKLINQIETEKEVLSTMPLKTKKNKAAYLSKLKELEEKYSTESKILEGRITDYVNKIKDIHEDSEIEAINKQLYEISSELYLINNLLDSFSKMGLDRIIYGLNNFYKDNLFRINKLVKKAINAFNDVGIKLTAAHFDYSHFTYEYMLVFYEEIDELRSDKMREAFENIYWRCPDLIIHLDLNIRYLYYTNKETIDEFYKEKYNSVLEKNNKSVELINEEFTNLVKRKDKLVAIDSAIILNNFINKKFVLADYDDVKIGKIFEKLVPDKEYFEQNNTLAKENIIKLNNTLKEYRDYLAFKFIIDDLKKKYNEKGSYKNTLKNKLKEITKAEDNLRKINLKIFKRKNGKNSLKEKDKIINDINATMPKVLELKAFYNDLEEVSFNDKVLNLINENSTYYDALSLALNNYDYLTNIIKKNDPNLTEDEVKLKVSRLYSLIHSPYNNIINNISLIEEKDIASIIVERYRLLNLDITKEEVLDGLDDLINTTTLAVNYIYLESSTIRKEDIEFVVNTLPIIEGKQ